MPAVRRSQVYETLVAPLAKDGEATFRAALERAGLNDAPMFRPEEVAQLGAALMAMAREQAAQAPTEP